MARRRALLLTILTILSAPPAFAQELGVTWDFETGMLNGWTATGDAFDRQPILEDNVAARDASLFANQQGYYWIGTYEDRWSPNQAPGGTRGDAPTGQMISDAFIIEHDRISFLVAGGTDLTATYVGLRVDGALVARAAGNGDHMLSRYAWDVSEWLGDEARIIVVDSSATSHVSVDDFRFYDVGGAGDDDAPLADGGLAPATGGTADPGATPAPSETGAAPAQESQGGAEESAPADDGAPPKGAPTDEGAPASAGATGGKQADESTPAAGSGGSANDAPTGTKDPGATQDPLILGGGTQSGTKEPASSARGPTPPIPTSAPFIAPALAFADEPAPPAPEATAVQRGPAGNVFGAIGAFFGSVFRGVGTFFGSLFGARTNAPDPFAARAITEGPTVAVDVAAYGDIVHVAYVESGIVRVATSRDRGATFADDVAASSGARTATQVIVGANAEAGVVVAWLERGSDGRTSLSYAQSADGGRVFSSPRWPAVAEVLSPPDLALAGRKAHLVWREGNADSGTLHHVDAAEAGGLAQRIVGASVGRFSVGAEGDRVDVAYSYHHSPGDLDTFHVESSDGGRRWRTAAENTIGNHGAQYNPDIVVSGGTTTLAFERAYPVAANPSTNHQRSVELLSYRSWLEIEPVDDVHRRLGEICACGDAYRHRTIPDMRPLLAARDGGGIHIAYSTSTNDAGRDLVVASQRPDGGWGAPSVAVGRARLGDVDLADAGGAYVLAFANEATGDVELRTFAGGSAIATPGPSRAPALAGVPGRGYVAWIDGTDGVDHVRFRAVDVPRPG